MWLQYLFASAVVHLISIPYGSGVRIPLFITPLKGLPQPIDVTSSFYSSSEKEKFFSQVTAWDVWSAMNVTVSEMYNRTVHRIISDANSLYLGYFKTKQLNVYQCGEDCHSLNLSDIEYYSGKSKRRLSGQTTPPITLGHLHEAVVSTLEKYFCFTMSFIEKELDMSSFNVTLHEWKRFLPRIAWYAVQCRADILVIKRSEFAELLREDLNAILGYNLAQLDSKLVLPYEKILNDKYAFEDDEIRSYILGEDDGSGDLYHWTQFSLYDYVNIATNFSIRDLEILYSWNSVQLYALEFIPLQSYSSCNGVISFARTMYNISKSILEDFNCPVALILSNSVDVVTEKKSDLENLTELSVLKIFTLATGIKSWIEIANILKLDYIDGIIVDTPRLREITRDNSGLRGNDILNLSVPQIVTNYISLNGTIYIYRNYQPMFHEILQTYGFTANELLQASGQPVTETMTITKIHELLLTTVSHRYNVYNIASLLGYSEYFLDDVDLAALPSSQWTDIINVVMQQSFKQVMHAFSYDLQTNPDKVSIFLQPDDFQTIQVTKPSFFNNQYINETAFCLFKDAINSFMSEDFKKYHKFYNNTIADTMMKKILFETMSLEMFLTQYGLNLGELDDEFLFDSIQLFTGFKLYEIECLYGNTVTSLLNGDITWKDIRETRLCSSFEKLTLLQIVAALMNAPTVNCGKLYDSNRCISKGSGRNRVIGWN